MSDTYVKINDKTYLKFAEGTPREEMAKGVRKYNYNTAYQRAKDNTGMFSMVADMRDAYKYSNKARNTYDKLQKTTDPKEREDLIDQLYAESAMENAYYNTEDDNLATSLVKQLGVGLAPVLAAAGAGGTAGSAFGPGGSALGSIVGAGAFGAYDAYNIYQYQNAVRDYLETGDLTQEDLDRTKKAAMVQGAASGLADVLTAGTSRTLRKAVVVGAAAAGGTNGFNQFVQRASVPGLDLLSEESMEEVGSAALVGSLYGGALGAGFYGLGRTGEAIKKDAAFSVKVDPATKFRDAADITDIKEFEGTIEQFKADEQLKEEALKFQKPLTDSQADTLADMRVAFDRPEFDLASARLDGDQVDLLASQPWMQDILGARTQIRNARLKQEAAKNEPKVNAYEDSGIKDGSPESIIGQNRRLLFAEERFVPSEMARGLAQEDAQKEFKDSFKFIDDTIKSYGPAQVKLKNPILQKLANFSFMTSPLSVARRDFLTRRVMNDEWGRLNFINSIGASKKSILEPLRKKLKKKGLLKDAHETIYRLQEGENARRNPDGSISWSKDGIDQPNITGELAEAVDTLSEAYKADFYIARQYMEGIIESKRDLGYSDESLATELGDIKKLNGYLNQFYAPRVRSGELWLQVGPNRIYSIPEKKSPVTKRGERLQPDPKSYRELRKRVKEETGVDLPVTPKSRKLGSKDKIKDYELFRPTNELIDVSEGKLKELLSDASLQDLLARTDGTDVNKLEGQLKSITRSQGLDALFKPRRNIGGYDNNYDQLMKDSITRKNIPLANFVYKDRIADTAGLLKEEPDAYASKLFREIYRDPDMWDVPARLQSFFAIGGSFSTASLGAVSMMSSVPLSLSLFTANPAQISRYLTQGMAEAAKISAQRAWTDRKKLGKIFKDQEMADEMLKILNTLATSPQDEAFNAKYDPRVSKQIFNTVEKGAYFMLNEVEKLTRYSAAAATYRMLKDNPRYIERAKKNLERQPGALEAINKRGSKKEETALTEVVLHRGFATYGRGSRAPFQRGLGRVLAPFINYPLQITEVLIDTLKGMNGIRGQVGALGVITSMALAFGLDGMPFWDVTEALYDIYGKLIGTEQNPKMEAIEALNDISPGLGTFAAKGAVAETTGIHLGQRVALGNPYSAFTQYVLDGGPTGRDIGFLLPKAGEIIDNFETQEGANKLRGLLPIFANNIWKAADIHNKGLRTSRGTQIAGPEEFGLKDAGLRAIGYNSDKIAMEQEAYYSTVAKDKQSVKYRGITNKKENLAYPHYKDLVETGNPEALAALRQEVIELAQTYIQNGDEWTKDLEKGFLRRLENRYKGETQGGTAKTKPRSWSQRDFEKLQESRRELGLQ